MGSFPVFYINQRISTYLDFFSFRMVANMEKWRDEWVADVKPSDEELAPKNADITKLLGCSLRWVTAEEWTCYTEE